MSAIDHYSVVHVMSFLGVAERLGLRRVCKQWDVAARRSVALEKSLTKYRDYGTLERMLNAMTITRLTDVDLSCCGSLDDIDPQLLLKLRAFLPSVKRLTFKISSVSRHYYGGEENPLLLLLRSAVESNDGSWQRLVYLHVYSDLYDKPGQYSAEDKDHHESFELYVRSMRMLLSKCTSLEEVKFTDSWIGTKMLQGLRRRKLRGLSFERCACSIFDGRRQVTAALVEILDRCKFTMRVCELGILNEVRASRVLGEAIAAVRFGAALSTLALAGNSEFNNRSSCSSNGPSTTIDDLLGQLFKSCSLLASLSLNNFKNLRGHCLLDLLNPLRRLYLQGNPSLDLDVVEGVFCRLRNGKFRSLQVLAMTYPHAESSATTIFGNTATFEKAFGALPSTMEELHMFCCSCLSYSVLDNFSSLRVLEMRDSPFHPGRRKIRGKAGCRQRQFTEASRAQLHLLFPIAGLDDAWTVVV